MDYNIDKQFNSHKMNSIQTNYVEDIKEHAKDLADLILHGCKDCREKAIALEKLEECVMWAVKSVALEEFPLE